MFLASTSTAGKPRESSAEGSLKVKTPERSDKAKIHVELGRSAR